MVLTLQQAAALRVQSVLTIMHVANRMRNQNLALLGYLGELVELVHCGSFYTVFQQFVELFLQAKLQFIFDMKI